MIRLLTTEELTQANKAFGVDAVSGVVFQNKKTKRFQLTYSNGYSETFEGTIGDKVVYKVKFKKEVK